MHFHFMFKYKDISEVQILQVKYVSGIYIVSFGNLLVVVQIVQSESMFCSKICPRGYFFYPKINSRGITIGTGRFIFTMTRLYTLVWPSGNCQPID